MGQPFGDCLQQLNRNIRVLRDQLLHIRFGQHANARIGQRISTEITQLFAVKYIQFAKKFSACQHMQDLFFSLRRHF
ncbi:hypothetical protein D3C87_1884240 [compost metagenome]